MLFAENHLNLRYYSNVFRRRFPTSVNVSIPLGSVDISEVAIRLLKTLQKPRWHANFSLILLKITSIRLTIATFSEGDFRLL